MRFGLVSEGIFAFAAVASLFVTIEIDNERKVLYINFCTLTQPVEP